MGKKLLFIGANRKYINPSTDLIIQCIAANYKIHFFGPGFSTEESLNRGIEKFVEERGPYDMIVFDCYLLLFDIILSRKTPFSSELINFSKECYAKHIPPLLGFVKKYEGKTCLIANMDIYGIKQKQIDLVEQTSNIIIDISMAKLTMEEKADKFGYSNQSLKNQMKGFWDGAGNDNWVNFLKEKRSSTVRLPHAVQLDEFSYVPIGQRKNIFAVPGARYAERKQFYRYLTLNQRFLKNKHLLTDRAYFLTKKSLSLKMYTEIRNRYITEIKNSKYCYVSGSLHRSPVRKYFEVPALGAVPVGQIFESFDELGFEDGTNFLVIEDSSTLEQLMASYPLEQSQKIVEKAQELILAQHTVLSRHKQIRETFDKIFSGSFEGSSWQQGRYFHF